MFCGGFAVVGNISPHFETAGDFLRVIALHPRAQWKVRRTAKNEIKLLIIAHDVDIAKIAQADVEAILNPVPFGRFFCEDNAFRLCLDRDKSSRGQSPCGDCRNGSNAAAEIQN